MANGDESAPIDLRNRRRVHGDCGFAGFPRNQTQQTALATPSQPAHAIPSAVAHARRPRGDEADIRAHTQDQLLTVDPVMESVNDWSSGEG